MPSSKMISTLVVNSYFWTWLHLLKIPLKWLLEKSVLLLKALNPINHLSNLLLTEKTDMWRWIFRPQTNTEWVFTLFPTEAIKLFSKNFHFVVNLTEFPIRLDCSLTMLHVQMMASKCQVGKRFQLLSWTATFGLEWIWWKSFWNGYSRNRFFLVKS